MKITLSLLIPLLLFTACSGKQKTNVDEPVVSYSLADFYSLNQQLDAVVEQTFDKLSVEQKAGQMIVAAAGRLGKPDTLIERLLKNNMLGGVLLLNGSVEGFQAKVKSFNRISKSSHGLPLIYSADAEPSLINRKINGSTEVPKTADIATPAQSAEIAQIISQDLKDIGINHNYAPVTDLSVSNEAITNRSYGSNVDEVVKKAAAFIQTSQEQGIIATAKHFPGHGLVKGDSHHKLVYIDGDFRELDVYVPLIQEGLLSIMIGHIAVQNNDRFNTNGYPASCSRIIVTDLLKNELGFKGLVVTDAMNMGALSNFENPNLEAIKAGCDMILMPIDESDLFNQILELYKSDSMMQEQIDESVKKIIRMKYCLGLF